MWQVHEQACRCRFDEHSSKRGTTMWSFEDWPFQESHCQVSEEGWGEAVTKQKKDQHVRYCQVRWQQQQSFPIHPFPWMPADTNRPGRWGKGEESSGASRRQAVYPSWNVNVNKDLGYFRWAKLTIQCPHWHDTAYHQIQYIYILYIYLFIYYIWIVFPTGVHWIIMTRSRNNMSNLDCKKLRLEAALLQTTWCQTEMKIQDDIKLLKVWAERFQLFASQRCFDCCWGTQNRTVTSQQTLCQFKFSSTNFNGSLRC